MMASFLKSYLLEVLQQLRCSEKHSRPQYLARISPIFKNSFSLTYQEACPKVLNKLIRSVPVLTFQDAKITRSEKMYTNLEQDFEKIILFFPVEKV